MKRIITILALAILIAGCASTSSNSAGTINGQKITYSDFIRSYQGHIENFQGSAKRAPTTKEKNEIFEDTWRNITKHVILKQLYKSNGIRVTAQEVIDTLIAHPPQYLKEHAAFIVDGSFNNELYVQSVRFDMPMNLSFIRREYLEHYVPSQKLKAKLIEKELNSKEAQLVSQIIVGKADFDLIAFDANEMALHISDSELKGYYDSNLEQFAMEPIYSVQYLSLVMEPLEQDRLFVKAVADSIYYALHGGRSMENVHRDKQGYLPGLNILDPGFVRVENMDDALFSLLESMPDNAYTRPQENGRGYTIYQKLQRTKSMMSYRALQIPPIVSPGSRDLYYQNAESTLGLVRKIGIKNAAEELDLKLVEHNNLRTEDLWHQDRLIVEMVNSKLLDNNKGAILEPIYSPITGSWIIIRLSENQVNRVKPFEQVREQIVSILMESRKHTLAKQKANQWIQKHKDGRYPEQDKDVISYQKAGLGSTWNEQSLDIAYVNAMLLYLNKKQAQPLQMGDYQVVILPKKFYSDSKAKPDKELLKQIYEQTKHESWFENMLNAEVYKAKVEIFTSP
ncbi:MAG: SurA N-terminal domain-containing protein [Candidatus Cloacimonetes bacterium]|nr:SurA N-terminal domain-containing protein [Candidatus Cloacimonadota bacterium]